MVDDPDVENISESGFSISLPDGRMFENFLEDQEIGGTSGNVIYEGNYFPSEEQRQALAGKTFDVFVKGKKIASTKVENVGDYDLKFSNSTGNVEGIQEVFTGISDETIENLSKHPNLASSLQGVADAYSINSLSFRTPEPSEPSEPETQTSSSNTEDSSKTQKAGMAAGAAALVVAAGVAVIAAVVS